MMRWHIILQYTSMYTLYINFIINIKVITKHALSFGMCYFNRMRCTWAEGGWGRQRKNHQQYNNYK